MRLIVLDRSPYANEADVKSDELLRACGKARGVDSVILAFEDSDDPVLQGVADDDIVLARADLRSDEDLVTVTEALWSLGQRGVRCLPSAEGLVAAEDKLRTFVRLRHAGIPTPSTVALCASGPRLEDLIQLQTRLQAFPVIVKRPVGSGGRDVWKCDDGDALTKLLLAERDARPEGAVLIQPYVGHRSATTLHVAAGAVVSSWSARPAPGDFRTDPAVAEGVQPAEPTPQEILLALSALDACGLVFGSVDFLHPDEGKPVCIDVNAVPTLWDHDPEDRKFAEAIVDCALRRA